MSAPSSHDGLVSAVEPPWAEGPAASVLGKTDRRGPLAVLVVAEAVAEAVAEEAPVAEATDAPAEEAAAE